MVRLSTSSFDGKAKNWPFFKKKMELYFARIDVAELLSEDVDIPLDSNTDEYEDTLEEINPIPMKNRKAAGQLKKERRLSC